MRLKYSKYSLMIFVASILALTSSLLTAFGMAELFQGLFVIFLVIDLGRFLVLNFVVDEWKNLRTIKWVITIILSLLFIYSAVGIYNKLNSMIPSSIQTAMVEAASYNKAQDNAEIKHDRSSNLAGIAQSEYQQTMELNNKDYENCIKHANGAVDAEKTCTNIKRKADRAASTALKQAMNIANADLDKTQTTINENVKNQSEIAGVLTTVCKILPNTDCKTYDGLQTALTVIILLVICGLDYLQLSIVLAVNTRKNKKDEEEIPESTPIVTPQSIILPTEPETKQIKIKKRSKKIKKKNSEIINSEIKTENTITSEEPLDKNIPQEIETSKNIPIKKRESFTQKTGFYK